MNYDLCLFTEIIESIEGITLLRDDYAEGISAKFYSGRNGKLVIIDTTDEYASDDTYKGHLRCLGCEDLIEAMFPKVLEEEPLLDIHKLLEELNLDKD